MSHATDSRRSVAAGGCCSVATQPATRRRQVSMSCWSRRDRRASAKRRRIRSASRGSSRERNKQAALLAEARAALAEQRARGASLAAAYDANEKKLAELTAQLDAKAGNLGEMFGVVRQVANDFSSVVHNSLISAQYPGSRGVRRQAVAGQGAAVDAGPRALLVRAAARDDRERQGRAASRRRS